MRRLLRMVALLAAMFGLAPEGRADVLVRVDLSSQTMSVAVAGAPRHHWLVSTGRRGYNTPNGVYRPQRLARHWYSRKYGGAMPHSIFFRGGYAIHGTAYVGRLGRPASHGCIRLHPAHAAALYGMVKAAGRNATRIMIVGSRRGRWTAAY